MISQSVDILIKENYDTLERKLLQLKESGKSVEIESINMLTEALEHYGKDCNQIRQISQISKVLGQSLGLSRVYCEKLEQASKIYDIGNIMICSEVYIKDEKLSFEEFEIIKKHTIFGHDILKEMDFPIMDLAAVIAKEHHEWWNGGGYPFQVQSIKIDIASRIVAVADTVGALFRRRPGRDRWTYDMVLKHLKEQSSVQFDPEIIKVFFINKDAIHEILKTDLGSAPTSWYS